MGRHKQPAIRERLLDECTDYALEHGLPARLEPLALAAGTSTRMLIYHFGTRNGLLREVLHQARRRQRDIFGALLRAKEDEPYLKTLSHAWSAITGAAGRPYLHMFGRLREDAEQQLWPGFHREATTDWLAPLQEGMGSIGQPEMATVVLAIMRGLIMDLEATDDQTRTTRAFTDFLNTLERTPSNAPNTWRDRHLAGVQDQTQQSNWAQSDGRENTGDGHGPVRRRRGGAAGAEIADA